MADNSRRISIITLPLRRRSHTESCITRLYENTHIPFELIVVSQEADEDTKQWLTSLRLKSGPFHTIYNVRNVGPAIGRNQGLRLATGKYIIFLDNDALVTEGWLEPLIQAIEKNSSLGAVGPLVLTSEGRVQYCSRYTVEREQEGKRVSVGLQFTHILNEHSVEIPKQCEVPWYPTTCLLVRREAMDKIGGFDENFALIEEDKDICLSMRRNGYRISFNSRARVIHSAGHSIDYRSFRNNYKIGLRDIKYFEEKWQCKVLSECSPNYLQALGASGMKSDEQALFSIFMRVVPS
ncbi:MAG: glycosyltransferase [Deltaproteobacteria bacterium]|nr:glycosyltransferase [Deltaproteobacteria bacterium]